MVAAPLFGDVLSLFACLWCWVSQFLFYYSQANYVFYPISEVWTGRLSYTRRKRRL